MVDEPRDDVDAQSLEMRIGSAWRELRRGAAMHAVRKRMWGDAPDALDLGQIDTLDLLVHKGEQRMSDLADALRIDASSATRAVARLVKLGLAARTQSPVDARGVVVVATPAGHELRERLAQRGSDFLAGVLEGFDDTERLVFAEMLERLVAAVDRYIVDTPQ